QIVLLGSSVEPSLHLQAGFLQNMTAYWHDKAGLFGHSNEMLGHDQALFGVSPPYQRLESTHSAGREVNYGLEKNAEFLPVDRPAQVSLELKEIYCASMHSFIEYNKSRLA